MVIMENKIRKFSVNNSKLTYKQIKKTKLNLNLVVILNYLLLN